ncbi:Uncharacterized protein HZ326_11716 [Fusarium oxysporum f. sp. albedinis]|nr:Uncharacterized protein HZ326_11716 [Fusarium oxysporum f. sp. albedinis]
MRPACPVSCTKSSPYPPPVKVWSSAKFWLLSRLFSSMSLCLVFSLGGHCRWNTRGTYSCLLPFHYLRCSPPPLSQLEMEPQAGPRPVPQYQYQPSLPPVSTSTSTALVLKHSRACRSSPSSFFPSPTLLRAVHDLQSSPLVISILLQALLVYGLCLSSLKSYFS